ncbi:helix-turn-helix domain-containing protein [Anatilimnocola sp. NA78]|uniref:helix-turn-helix domain-containing protein n=1 Tax=Anatilimnocola sp. NA78 TaxID=3415683 RepID=UPI003CE4EC81
MLTLRDAAATLGYSISGLRKLCARGDVRFFQARKHSPLKFRPEWLDEFIERGSKPDEPVVRTRVAKPKRPAVLNKFGFDSSLTDI